MSEKAQREAKRACMAELELALGWPDRFARRHRVRQLVRLLLARVSDHAALAQDLLALSAEELPDAG